MCSGGQVKMYDEFRKRNQGGCMFHIEDDCQPLSIERAKESASSLQTASPLATCGSIQEVLPASLAA